METNFKIGMPSLEVAKIIIVQNGIKKVKLLKHQVGKNWSQIYKTKDSQKKNFLKSFNYLKIPSETFIVSSKKFNNFSLADLKKLTNKTNHEVISLISKVITNQDEIKHIPMMNFHPENNFGKKEIIEAIRFIQRNNKGVLLSSGRFFHYYGNYLLSENEWQRFMEMFLIPFYLVHPGYIGYRLVSGYCTLRLTNEDTYKPEIPRVIKILD